jgi:hypothetical protein
MRVPPGRSIAQAVRLERASTGLGRARPGVAALDVAVEAPAARRTRTRLMCCRSRRPRTSSGCGGARRPVRAPALWTEQPTCARPSAAGCDPSTYGSSDRFSISSSPNSVIVPVINSAFPSNPTRPLRPEWSRVHIAATGQSAIAQCPRPARRSGLHVVCIADKPTVSDRSTGDRSRTWSRAEPHRSAAHHREIRRRVELFDRSISHNRMIS